MNIQTTGVIGAGVMGRGLAQALSQSGYGVVLVDVSDEILSRATQEIKENVRLQRLFAGGGKSEPAGALLQRIECSTDLRKLERADFVIENVTENFEIKKEVYAQLNRICPPQAVFAANTSAIPITRLASLTDRPDRVIGMHFMNPVPLKPTVEVIKGHHTSADTVAAALGLLARMGKEGIVVNDSPGFVTNRVLMLTINEAVFLLHERVADVESIDRLFKTCFGHKMGPLETADLIGLDTILNSIEVLYESFNDSKYRPCPLLKRMVDAGLHGRKSGAGFYTY
ncbi:MAG TPA: 3-hydroxyacyl-CoA dehydrogenase NAD-binding domain-containing protein [Pyrinomonadaceae bacterium]|jgi:3-hydroxybutyryl-CoA dehydrogenase